MVGDSGHPGQDRDDQNAPPPYLLAPNIQAQPPKEKQERKLDRPKTGIKEKRKWSQRPQELAILGNKT